MRLARSTASACNPTAARRTTSSSCLLPTLLDAARAIKVGPTDRPTPQPDMGPVITAQHRERVAGLVATGEKEGAKVICDGRGVKVPEAPKGFYLGATIVDLVQHGTTLAREEVFGPVLNVMRM